MAKRSNNRLRHSDLFVVRIWCADGSQTQDGATDAAGAPACRGRVQRAISGETRDFEGWPALIEVLEELLSTVRPPKQTNARHDGNERPNRARE